MVRLLIADALARLSAEHRAVFLCSYYLGWTTAQIADDLQMAESTVKSRLHFAVRALWFSLQTQPEFRHAMMVEAESTAAGVTEVAVETASRPDGAHFSITLP